MPNAPTNSHPATPKEIKDLLDFEKQNLTIDQVLAKKQYIRADMASNGYSMSQNLNHKLDHGEQNTMTMNERFVNAQLTSAMHPLGSDMVLYRGAHQGTLERLGVKGYSQMTETQLKKALIGRSFTTTSYTSTSYDLNQNPFLKGSQSGGREVEMIMKVGKNTKVVLGEKSQAEIILGVGTNYKVTDVKFTGRQATRRGYSKSLPVVQVEVETF